MSSPTTAVIGPSHLHSSHLSDEDRERSYARRGVEVIEAHPGLPVWSLRVPTFLEEQAEEGRSLVWVVADWKMNNADHAVFASHDPQPGPIFLDTLGHVGNVSRAFMGPDHLAELARRGMRAIDEVVRRFPRVRLVFWCLYKRTRASTTSSYPRFAWYDETVARYRANVVDIDDYTTPEEFNADLVTDPAGHPSRRGHELLGDLFSSAQPNQMLEA